MRLLDDISDRERWVLVAFGATVSSRVLPVMLSETRDSVVSPAVNVMNVVERSVDVRERRAIRERGLLLDRVRRDIERGDVCPDGELRRELLDEAVGERDAAEARAMIFAGRHRSRWTGR